MSTTDQPSGINTQNPTKPPIFHPQNQRNFNIPVNFPPSRTPRILERNQEACNLFKMGKCYYGGNCKYLHLGEPKRTKMHETGQFLEGRRMGNGVVRYCKWTLQTCPYGQKCQFVHKVEDTSQRMLERSVNGVVLRGQTKRGQEFDKMNDFKFREMMRKTKLCHKYERFGSCPFGGDCHYAHGKQELQKSGSLSNLDSEPNAFAANLLTAIPKNNTSRRTGFCSFGLEKKRKKSWFKWDVEKISHIYADWIDLSPVY